MPVLHTVSVEKKQKQIFRVFNVKDLLLQFRLVEKLLQKQHLTAQLMQKVDEVTKELLIQTHDKQSCLLLDAPNHLTS